MVHCDTGRAIARIDLPGVDHFPRFGIDDVDCVLVLDVDKNATLSVAYSALGSVATQRHATDHNP